MEKLKSRIIVILSILLIAVFAYTVTAVTRLNRKLDIEHQNYVAATDTIHDLTLRNGEMVNWTSSLIADKRAREQELADERLDRREIERQLRSKIASLSKTIANFKMDTIVLIDTVTVEPDSSISTGFRYSDEWTALEGKIRIKNNLSETQITNLCVNVPITVGQTEDYQIFVHSLNPYVTITDIESSVSQSVVNDKAFRRLSLGVYGGVGFGYDMITKTLGFGPQVGVGVNYRLW